MFKGLLSRASAAIVAAAVVVVPLSATAASAKGGEIGGAGNDWYLNDQWTGSANTHFQYGRSTDQAYIGDWDGDGVDTLAVRRGQTFYFTNSLTGGSADAVINYGRSGDTVLVGDWDGNGTDTLAVRRGQTYYVKNSLSGGSADHVVNYGRPSDAVLVGDWDGDGDDTFAVRRGQTYYVKNSISPGSADKQVNYGKSSDAVLVGDWDGDGDDTFAVRRGATYYVKNSVTAGGADKVLTYGRSTDSAFSGDWNGDGADTLGVRRVFVAPDGTWNNPFRPDSWFGTTDWVIAVGAVERGVDDLVYEANPYNEVAPAGWEYARVPVTITNTSDERFTPYYAIDFTLVTGGGNSYELAWVSDGSGPGLQSFVDLTYLYPDGVDGGYIYFMAPSSAFTGSSRWRVEDSLTYNYYKEAYVSLS